MIGTAVLIRKISVSIVEVAVLITGRQVLSFRNRVFKQICIR